MKDSICAVAKRKPKNFKLAGIRTQTRLCDAGEASKVTGSWSLNCVIYPGNMKMK